MAAVVVNTAINYMSNEDTGLGLPTLVGRSVPYPIGSWPLKHIGASAPRICASLLSLENVFGGQPETLSSWGCHSAATLASSSCIYKQRR